MLNSRKAFVLTTFAILLLFGCKRETIRSPEALAYGADRCGGPPSWSIEGLEKGELVDVNRIDIEGSKLQWNRVPVDRTTLIVVLHKVGKMEWEPITVAIIDSPTDCSHVKSLRRLMETILNCSKLKVCVEYSKAGWAKKHPPLPPPPAN